MKIGHFLLCILAVFSIITSSLANFGEGHGPDDPYAPQYIIAQDTVPLQDREGDFINNPNSNPFDLDDPSIIEQNVEYDPVTGNYIITETIGDDFFRPPTYMTFEEYSEYQAQQQQRAFFDELSGASGNTSRSGLKDPMDAIDIKKNLLDRLFGGSKVDIRPQGQIGLTFGVDFQRRENPGLTLRQQRQGGFDFDMDIRLNVTGKIGEKLNLATNYNTQATFDFDNQLKLQYDSEAFSDDDIIKKIEAGNVSLPLKGSLIQGSQSLFGIKTELQFGHLSLTLLASQQKSKRQELQIQGGSQFQEFETRADEYDENRHFFLTHYNRQTFEGALVNLPQINSLFKINRMEVWITNDRNETENVRDIVALADMGESIEITNENPLYQLPASPRNRDINGLALPGRLASEGNSTNAPDANGLYDAIRNNERVRNLDDAVSVLENVFGQRQSRDFEKVSARKLSNNEYTFHPELGFISLNVNLQPDQVLGVAFEYDYNGKTFRVGQFSTNASSTNATEPNPIDPMPADTTSAELGVLFVKMLKSTTQRVDLPTWDLMMKNVYSVGAFQVNQEDFKLDIFYEDPGKGEKRFLPDSRLAGVPLLQVFNLDNLNVLLDPCPDGIFDFVTGVTINPRNGRIMFPVLEPFSSAIADNIDSEALKLKYDYGVLYDSTVIRAREYQELNRFTIRGSYKSSVSSEISLGSFNLPENSVTVRAGGQTLIEGSDYEVDYNIGRVKILNDAYLNSGLPINVSFEDNTLFGFQTKTLLGVRADYEVNENFNIGATYMHLFERPFTQKVNIGEDPINNRIYGLDVNYSTGAPWLTRAVDAIPFINTKAESSITVSAEAAVLKPGHARAINQGRDENGDVDKSGVVYVDDFEGSTSSFDLRTPAANWVLASVPQNDERNNNPLFPEADLIDTTLSGVNRALLNWYRIDQSVRGDNSNPYTAAIPQTEVFPNVTVTPGLSNIIQTLDLTYYPEERGPYNFDVPGGTEYSEGLGNNGQLLQPETRWAGIMRALNTNDFQAANIEYLEFWMLDPYLGGDNNPGDLYINIGNISEDILRDSRKFFENGLPTPDQDVRTDETGWAVIPRAPQITNAFVNDVEQRKLQDVGFDGLNDAAETSKFDYYLQAINSSNLTDAAKTEIAQDPSNDNFIYFRNFPNGTSVLDRYRRHNMPDGNSPAAVGNERQQQGNSFPDSEDINRDNTLSETESYYQYKVPLQNNDGDNRLDISANPFVTDTVETAGRVWYRFKIPLDQYTSKIGSIQDFRSIRFIRMYMHGFDDEITLRFARLELVRNQWRRYQRSLAIYKDPTEEIDTEVLDGESNVIFDVNSVNIEENSSKFPFPYTLPAGIQREQSTNTTFPDILQNEQSLSMEVCNLEPDNARAIYKNILLDMRLYKRLRMFVHAEASDPSREGMPDPDAIDDDDLSVIMRIGSDFENNYYEYEIPLKMSRNTMLGVTTPEYKEEVWKSLNNIDIAIEQFRNVKVLRNASTDPNAFSYPFEIDDVVTIGGEERVGKLRVKGNPNLGNVKGVMIGVINRSDQTHCAEIWLNELRLSGFDERGGFAAIAKVDAQLADFGNITAAGNYSTIGWGGIEQKLNDRAREEIIQFDLTGDAELGKFFGEKSGIKIPFLAQYSQTTRIPEYDPYDLDVPLKEKLRDVAEPQARDSIRDQAIDFTEIKGYNFTNVRKERTGGKGNAKTPMPWNIENFSFTYAYTKTTHHDPIISLDEISKYKGIIDYKYNRPAKYITPFKKLIKKDKYLKLISEFNFNPLPNSFSVSSAMDRNLQKTSYRFTDLDPQFSTFYNKQFIWNRSYDLKWDLTKALKLSFNATNFGVVDELKNFDEDGLPISKEIQKEFIWDGIRDFGRTKNYGHSINVNYTLPFKKIPFLEWVNVKAQYRGDYSWDAASLNTENLGNIIQNGQRRQVNGDLDFTKLYNKSKFLKKINAKKRNKKNNRGGKARVRGGGDKNDKGGKDDKNKSGKDAKGGKGKKGKKEKKDGEPSATQRALIRPLMLLRKVRMNYSENYSTVVPGYSPQSKWFGQAPGFDSPGWSFVSGLQPNITDNDDSNDWLTQGDRQGWFVDDVLLNQQVLQTYTQNIDAKVSIQPIDGFNLEVEASRSLTENNSLYFKDTLSDGISEIRHVLPREVGSFSISYFAMNTLFDKDIRGLFERFLENRSIISNRLNPSGELLTVDGASYREGYGPTQRNVLLPAFIAAYTDQDASTVEVDKDDYTRILFKESPRPNWQLTYDGLSKVGGLKDIFAKFTVTHGYKSNLTVNSYTTSIDYRSGSTNADDDGNYYSRFEIPNIVVDEQFAPLLGIQMELQNGISMDVDFRKSRNLEMTFGTNNLDETKSSEYVFGFGYTMRDVNIGFLTGKKKKKGRGRKGSTKNKKPKDPGAPKEEEKGSDMNIEFNFSWRDDVTFQHSFGVDDIRSQPTRGTRTVQFSPSVDYDINKRLNVRLFFDYNKTTSKLSIPFPITNTRGGITITFSLE